LGFKTLVSATAAKKLNVVDSRQWKPHWNVRWVAYADLIGFADRCSRSPDIVVNNIVRFHRAVASVVSATPDVTLFQFTDAAFGVCESLPSALKFASGIHHACLAHNHLVLAAQATASFDFTIVPRITIAHGEVLSIPPHPSPDPMYLGVDPGKLLAGRGIVEAYNLEKLAVGGVLAVSEEAYQLLTGSPVGGDARVGRALKRFVQSPSMFKHDRIRDFPWLLMNPNQPAGDELVADGSASLYRKIRTQLAVCALGVNQFRIRHEAATVAKHAGGLQRHLIELVEGLRGRVRPKRVSIAEIEEYVANRKMQNC
jgi:hypothetical protein